VVGRVGIVLLALAVGCSQGAFDDPGAAGGSGGLADSGGGGAGGSGGAVPDGWVEVPNAPDTAGATIAAAWSAGIDDFFFIANSRDPGSGAMPWRSRVLRWTAGAGWREELVIAPASDPAVALSGVGPNDVWTAGEGHIFHRDAAGWQMVPDDEWKPAASEATGPFNFVGVVARGFADDVWFATPKLLLQRTPKRWSAAYVIHDPPEPRNPTDTLYWIDGLWPGRGAELWVSGTTDGIGSTQDPPFIERVVDAALVGYSPGFFLTPVLSVWPTSDGGYWFAEPGFYRAGGGGQSILVPLRHYDGSATIDGVAQTGNDDPLTVRSIWGRGDDDLWAAGGYDRSGRAAAFHYDGVTWTEVLDAPPATNYRLVTGDAQWTWLVTDDGRFLRRFRR
jgi:hypothetical protein